MKYSCLINGYDSLNLTKLDVLDDLAEIKIAVKYMVNGEELPGFPGSYRPFRMQSIPWIEYNHFAADLGVLAIVDVSYVTLPGWQSSITSITSFDELPNNCKKYVKFIEDFLSIPIEWVGVGPGRESMLKKDGDCHYSKGGTE